MGWYYYLEERMTIPFKARCKLKRGIPPLCAGENVDVLGMAPEAESIRNVCSRSVAWP
jgi:Calcium binding